jgi:hypothetical protein
VTKDHACFGPSLDYVSYACKLMLSDAGSVVCNHNQGEKRRAYASEVPNPAGFGLLAALALFVLVCFAIHRVANRLG